ncbi:MAG: peptidase T [Eubacteriaceae bacterium]|nr:peptidase T [Eubacteriaceae bacterium]
MRAFERLIGYSAFPSASDENSESCPSTPEQLEFGRALVKEMRELGISDAVQDENGYVYGSIPATPGYEDSIVIGFIAHMDVVCSVPFRDIKPIIVENYDGGDVVQNEEKHIVLSPSEFPVLKKYKGKTLVVTDGTTLLGADDKAGVSEIMTMAERLIADPSVTHGKVMLAFTPDEEIGRGADRFNVPYFGADYAYTCDGAAFGEVCYETFNASSLTVTVTGKSIHPGSAKGRMINAAAVAMRYDSLLPANERPEYTEGYDGFYHMISMEGDVDSAVLRYILRDHDEKKLETREQTALKAAEYLNGIYPEGTVKAEVKKSYRNMARMILPHRELIDIAFDAITKAGGRPFTEATRGGTDGSTLSYMGLPCPNLGTGSHNHHGRSEFAVAEDMDSCVEALINIAHAFGGIRKQQE